MVKSNVSSVKKIPFGIVLNTYHSISIQFESMAVLQSNMMLWVWFYSHLGFIKLIEWLFVFWNHLMTNVFTLWHIWIFSFMTSDLNKNQDLYNVKFRMFVWYVYIQCQVCLARIAISSLDFLWGQEKNVSLSLITILLL